MKKYNYFVDGTLVPKKDFFDKLKSQCRRIVDTQVIAGWCGVDVVEFDEKKYKRCLRSINEGVDIMFFDGKYKVFRRKEA